MNGTALVYPFDGLTTREQVVLLYQLVMTVYPFALRSRQDRMHPDAIEASVMAIHAVSVLGGSSP